MRAIIIAFELLLIVSMGEAAAASATDPLAGSRLYADVQRYAELGEHRFGSATDRATTEWLAEELQRAGLQVTRQRFVVGQQFTTRVAQLQVGDEAITGLPMWWPPKQGLPLRLKTTIALDDGTPARGKIVWVSLAFDGGAYLSERQREAIAQANRREPSAILLTIDVPSGQPYAYNVRQDDAPWPVPVMIVGAANREALQFAQREARAVSLTLEGRYEHDVSGQNVIARLDRGAQRTLVISTPTTGWFTCACERGSGIAVFLALARYVAASDLPMNFLFVATAGHEIGHSGMDAMLGGELPAPERVRAWLHLGASVACHSWRQHDGAWTRAEVDARPTLFFSPSLRPVLETSFADVPVNWSATDRRPAAGELRDVQAAGYRDHAGLAATHTFFHTSRDMPDTTSAAILEPVALAFAASIRAFSLTP